MAQKGGRAIAVHARVWLSRLTQQAKGTSASAARKCWRPQHFCPRVEALEERSLLSLTIHEFAAPFPLDITAGPDGNLWFTGNNQTVGGFRTTLLGRLTPAGQVTEFGSGIVSNNDLQGIAKGPDGNLWFTEPGASRIGRITPTGQITEFSAGLTPQSFPFAITAGPDGNLWFTEAQTGGKIGRITPADAVTEFPTPTANSTPEAITAGPDGNVWFTEETTDRVGRITPAGTITEFPTPTANSRLEGITAGPDGNLWFTEFNANQIGRITPAGAITEFRIPTSNSMPFGITVAPDGNLWFTEFGASQIGQITPTGTVTEFPTPVPDSAPSAITVGPDGNLWFTEPNRNRIAQLLVPVPGPPNQRFVAQVYQDLLHRRADPGGLASFTNLLDQGLLNRSQVVLTMENSSEYRANVVRDLYSQFLHRDPDPSGFSAWVNFLGQGGTRNQLEALIVSSPEYFSRRGGGANSGFLQAIYQDVLGRAPDATGIAFWNQILTDGDPQEKEDEPASPARRREVAASILQSQEASQNQVQSWYGLFLHRAPDPIGLNGLSEALHQGLAYEVAIAVLIGSEEYFARV